MFEIAGRMVFAIGRSGIKRQPKSGIVNGIDDSKRTKGFGFKIVHQYIYAPHDNGECYHGLRSFRQIEDD